MEICTTINELKKWRKAQTKSVGFVPTMGCLHKGHQFLMKEAKKRSDVLIISISVNPTQFLEHEDFNNYPKKIELDISICKEEKVDYLFLPNKDMIYDKDEPIILAPKIRSFILEGYSRPAHFDGVLQIVLKLFNLIQPHYAFFGKKDAQQLILVQHMVNRLFLSIKIIPCEIVRDDNGLALSSRNVYLNKKEKIKALLLSKSLKLAYELIVSNELNVEVIIRLMQK